MLIFGDPAVGTPLMKSGPSAALDLPLRVAVWEEPDGTVWLGYHDPAAVARQHGIQGQDTAVTAMRRNLAAAVRQAAVPY